MELRAKQNQRIRLVFYSFSATDVNSYNLCDSSNFKDIFDWLSTNNAVTLEWSHDYDDDLEYQQRYDFELLFVTFTQKKIDDYCPTNMFDCNDNSSMCIDSSLRCNGLNECRSEYDEFDCKQLTSSAVSSITVRYFWLFVLYFNTLT
ncbi:unnamed protein product [Didymodactylos carnosus]|uniref:Uncharacterized protein n=1 Tax=Didymodactylos carnosus TaxID=1234261 RepID=A0A8S2WZI2_9BILA|nr:unnamed protein product [Didymodactylos carnosus]